MIRDMLGALAAHQDTQDAGADSQLDLIRHVSLLFLAPCLMMFGFSTAFGSHAFQAIGFWSALGIGLFASVFAGALTTSLTLSARPKSHKLDPAADLIAGFVAMFGVIAVNQRLITLSLEFLGF